MNASFPGRVGLGFVAGALGVLIFHQGFIAILNVAGAVPNTAWSFHPTEPLHVPQVLSLAFWGGLWGTVLVFFLEMLHSARRLWAGFLFGGIFPPLVGMLIVAPLKGTSVDWTDWHRLFLSFVINGAWGLGTLLAYRGEQRLVS